MKVVAKTDSGFLIEATGNEIAEIVTSVTGAKPKEIKIGQKIPAIDYASTITKIKTLSNNFHYKRLFEAVEGFKDAADNLKESVENAASIEL